METLYRSSAYHCLGQEEYVDLVCEVLERLPKNVVIQRLTGDPHPKELIAPPWALEKRKTTELIQAELVARDAWQGKKVYR